MSLDLAAYDYELPKHLIAQKPVPNRADARLLVVDRASGELEHRHVRDLPEILQPGDALVLNNTRVVPARLVGFRKETGGRWEGLFLQHGEQGVWLVMGHTRGKLQPGEDIVLLDRHGRESIELHMIGQTPEGKWLAKPKVDLPLLELLERVGRVPLPPYIRKGEMLPEDREHYQTVYARVPGAVAAPTAGLHFTENLLDRLSSRGIEQVYLTLHVGLGTFAPVKTANLAEHRMHAEWGELTAESVERLRAVKARGGRIVAVGTTSVRLLETAAADGELKPFRGETDLFIRPPYTFRAIDCLMTNFHLPKTTLLVLVRTFGGDALIRRAYEEAVREEYRFYSYGDAMLIL
ncbi:MAG: tRNA preQ1(34) S-adenosylmethionine ribosyltransferase-isomerase QueA [Planctomycetota bacterium]|nr:MAG: tRNA preQ1(34) S-adenosylmethionine ribosyltransferase-isomerase QueA [Planctomycetota bacterium]